MTAQREPLRTAPYLDIFGGAQSSQLFQSYVNISLIVFSIYRIDIITEACTHQYNILYYSDPPR
jgi:hypothetical protein